jgi:hypothetical protein
MAELQVSRGQLAREEARKNIQGPGNAFTLRSFHSSFFLFFK